MITSSGHVEFEMPMETWMDGSRLYVTEQVEFGGKSGLEVEIRMA